MERLMLLDGFGLVYRGYFALPPLTTKDGRMVNAVYGFASMLFKAWNDLKPTHIALTFDMAGPTFRHKKFAKYKATRVKADQALYDQIKAFRKACGDAHIKTILGTGELATLGNVARASMVAMMAGSDFINSYFNGPNQGGQ